MQVPDQIKSAVIAQHVPKAIKRFIKMVPADITADYATLKGAILAFLTRDRAYTPMGLALRDDDAMLVDAIDDNLQQEVNALVKGKGKGNPSPPVGWQRLLARLGSGVRCRAEVFRCMCPDSDSDWLKRAGTRIGAGAFVCSGRWSFRSPRSARRSIGLTPLPKGLQGRDTGCSPQHSV